MQNPTHDELEDLFRKLIVPFYHVARDIRVPEGDRHLENDAEHSWSLAFLACALAPLIDQKLDVGLIAQFATVHDIVEAYAGDTSNFDSVGMQSKHEREMTALSSISREFAHFPWIAETAMRYEARDTDEARFVYSLDKYLPVMYDYLDTGQYLRELKMTREAYIEHLYEHREKAQAHLVVGKYYDEIRALVESKVDHFYHENPESSVE